MEAGIRPAAASSEASEMKESVSRKTVALAVAAIGLAACTDTTPWAYPTEPDATAQRPAPIRTEVASAPQSAPAHAAPKVIAATPAPVTPPPPAATYAPPLAPAYVPPPPVAVAPPVTPPPPVVTYAPPRIVAAPPPAPVVVAPPSPPAVTAPPRAVGAAPPVAVAAAAPRPIQPQPPARPAPAPAPMTVVEAPAATTVYVPARPMLTEKSGLIDIVLSDSSGRPDGIILKDKTVIRFSPAFAAAMDPDKSRLAPGRPIVVRGTFSGSRSGQVLNAVQMGTDIYSMVTLGY